MKDRPVTIPKFLVGYNNSFVYSEDVAKTIVDDIMTSSAPDIRDQVEFVLMLVLVLVLII